MATRLHRIPLDFILTGLASIFLIITMFFPWYEKSYVPTGLSKFVKTNLNAFQVFGWVEGAILLVALAILYLIYTRATGKQFRLPGGDGFIIVLAGLWIEVLLIYRLFARPGGSGQSVTVGIQWGIFIALLTGAAIMALGGRIRVAGEGRRPISPFTREPRGGPDVIPDEQDEQATPAQPTAAGKPKAPQTPTSKRARKRKT
jgi:hypothetical protein